MGIFNKTETHIKGLYIIEQTAFYDKRGFFMETWNEKDFRELGIECVFVQDNHSKSAKGVLRGIHFQEKHQQEKLVRCISGKALDVAVDLRAGSSTFGDYFSVILSEQNMKQLLIPEGFGHAFVSLEDGTQILYKATDYYCSSCEGGIGYDDEDLNIDWDLEAYGIKEFILSERDKVHPTLKKWLERKNGL